MGAGIYIVALIIAAGLAFIPANIAKKKGYSFGLWWVYGWLLWIVAIIHVNLIPDKNNPENYNSNRSLAEEIGKYKELFDQGVLTEEEYLAKKEDLLKL